MKKEYPQVAYGAVYFRKSNPPGEDWERDYTQAASDGMNMFRHWFLWGSIEIAPGIYDWSEYDRHLELAAKNNIGTVIAEFAESVPEWFFNDHKDCFSVFRDGRQAPYSGMGVSCMTGGFVPGGLCMDNPKTKEYVEGFLRALAEHYKGHPGLFGYDVWNECNYNPDVCYCEHTQKRFRKWLAKKYGSLENLAESWYRYSYSSWEQVQAPRVESQSPDCMDWLQFRKENYYENYQWKVQLLRSIDPDARITGHGVAASLDYTYGDGNDDWLASKQVESYGMTWVIGRKGSEPWKQWQAVDLLRGSSKDKIWWHAEMQGGPLWLQPQVIGREKEDGRVATADDVRLWHLVSLAGGARGVLHLRWRSLLDGPLFGAFGLYNDDGTPNDRSEMSAKLAKWANSPETKDLFAAQPEKAEVGIIVLDQIQEFNRIIQQAGAGKFYARCMWGAYRMFFDNHIPVDFVHFDDIDQYSSLYFPYPIQLNAAQADKLRKWVEKGGKLISEGLPGYFADRGKVCTKQPGNTLSEMFGVTQKTVEFMPDIGDRIRFSAFSVEDLPGGLFRQSYDIAGAECMGTYPDGETAAVISKYGSGTAVLLGTFPSEGYFRESQESTKTMICKLLEHIDITTPLKVSNKYVQVRMCRDNGKHYFWLLNHDVNSQDVTVTIKKSGKVGQIYWGNGDDIKMDDNVITAKIPGKDAIIFEVNF